MRLPFGVALACCALAEGLVVVPDSRLSDAGQSPTPGNLPLAWLHIPKTGSSFGNVLMHTPKICPGVPKSFAIDGNHCLFGKTPLPGPPGTGRWEMMNLGCPAYNNISLPKDCPGLSKWGQHESVGTNFEKMYQGRGAALFREWDQRMLSHYDYFLRPFGVPLMKSVPKLEGCMVKMMTRSGDDFAKTCAGGPAPSDEETEEAIRRLNQFAFVGLAEKWEKSVCLFRKMYGGECVGADFANTRPAKDGPKQRQRHKTQEQEGQSSATQEQEGESYFGNYDPAHLKGFVDRHDSKLYKAAVDKFNALCWEHGVNNDVCKACYEHKDIAYTPDQR